MVLLDRRRRHRDRPDWDYSRFRCATDRADLERCAPLDCPAGMDAATRDRFISAEEQQHVESDSHLEQSLGRRALLRILNQRIFDEVVKGDRPLGLVLQRGRFEAGLGHEKERTHRMKIEHRRLQFGEFDPGDAHRPDVAQLIVATFAFDGGHLGCHP